MPHPLVLGLFQDAALAAEAAKRLRSLGLDRGDLSLVASSLELEGRLAGEMDATPGVEIEDSRAAARLGEIGGYVLAAVAIVLPGVGPIVTAGPLSAELGEAAGHLAGHLARVLQRAGLPGDQAARWETSVASGALLLGAHVRRGSAEEVRTSLVESGAAEVAVAEWARRQ